ncbi:type II secretion system F family protein [Arthrobacter sp. CDRTa11]|uniref:type II secretion system F family protein n=1 Tax=Arthrobacter sp. CDRTa11 TaxID=2651199 RepID=UPI002265A340|nr:type II secretion system F family protein [Arthrobacter sp. CDRTa11]UZX04489.1 type II secretion system F family protein [Arthrobacter sp. CDRTa11]
MTESFLPVLSLVFVLTGAATLAFAGHGRARTRLLSLCSAPASAAAGKAGDRFRSHDTSADSRRAGNFEGLRDTPMILELVAAMLDSGSGIGRSLELVASAASSDYRSSLRPVVSALAIGADWETAWRSSEVRLPEILELRDALGFAALTGAPSSAILYAQAARLRRERFRAAEKCAASLGVKLVIPLGLCSLPAFICLGVIPVLLALVPSGS